MSAGCDAAVPFRVADVVMLMIRCGAEITSRYRYACVHEHVVDRGNCPEHEPVPGEVNAC